jgi:hypothetical protein
MRTTPTELHRLLAEVPEMLRRRQTPALLVLTTNYDDALERALDDRDEEYGVLWYEAKRGSACGHFIHRGPEGTVAIDRPNEYAGLGMAERTVILELHGAIDRTNPRGDSYVITEDNCIQYLSRSDIADQIPITVRERMGDSHFLSLGYSLRDWNLRTSASSRIRRPTPNCLRPRARAAHHRRESAPVAPHAAVRRERCRQELRAPSRRAAGTAPHGGNEPRHCCATRPARCASGTVRPNAASSSCRAMERR